LNGDTDVLRIYGLSFEHPLDARLEFEPTFRREEGNIAVKLPNGIAIFVSWGRLSKVREKLGSAQEHADYSLERLRKGAKAKLELVERREMEINGHVGIFTYAKVRVRGGGFFATELREVRSLHVHCDKSERYFIIYGASPQEGSELQARALELIAGTFKCHNLK